MVLLAFPYLATAGSNIIFLERPFPWLQYPQSLARGLTEPSVKIAEEKHLHSSLTSEGPSALGANDPGLLYFAPQRAQTNQDYHWPYGVFLSDDKKDWRARIHKLGG